MKDWTKEHQNTEETKWEVTNDIKAEGVGEISQHSTLAKYTVH